MDQPARFLVCLGMQLIQGSTVSQDYPTIFRVSAAFSLEEDSYVNPSSMEKINYVSEEFQMICKEQKVYLALS